MASHMIELMLNNYQVTSTDKLVTHVRMEKIVLDYDSSLRCLFAFMQKSRPIDQTVVKRIIAKVDSKNHRGHVTSGEYDNAQLVTYLSQDAFVNAIEERYHAIFNHSSASHC